MPTLLRTFPTQGPAFHSESRMPFLFSDVQEWASSLGIYLLIRAQKQPAYVLARI